MTGWDGATPPTAVVIGSGSAGLTVALGLAGLGRRVAVVEAARVGGDCTNTGCIPSKTLLHLSRLHEPHAPGTEARQVFAEVRRVRDDLERSERDELIGHPLIRLVEGRARLAGRGRVLVDPPATADRPAGAPAAPIAVSARHIVIATGSSPVTVEVPGLPAARALTNDTLFELDEAPAHLVILGGGAIGAEMATAFARLGSRVSVIEAADRLLPREAPEVGSILARALAERGVTVRTFCRATGFDESSQTLTLDGVVGHGTERLDGVDRVLMALGRRPNTAGLALAEHCVALDGAGIRTDSWGRTSAPGVWAAGDVTGRTGTTHGAGAAARRVVRAIGLPYLPRRGRMPTLPTAVFADPEVASVGLSLTELQRSWPERARHRIRVDLADTDRGLTDRIRHGAVIVDVARLTGKVLRATVVGPGAAEMIGLFTLAIDRGVSMHRIFTMVHPYPAVADAIRVAADEYTRLTLADPRSELAAWVRGVPARLSAQRGTGSPR